MRSLGLLLLLMACGQRQDEPLTAEAVVEARRATAALPAALRDLRAGRYGQAEEALAAVRSALPDVRHGATAAALLGLAGAGEYRRLVASIETNLGLARFRARRYPAAIEALERAVRIDPRSRVAWVDLGVALFHAQRFVEAAMALRQARALGAGGSHLELRAGQAAAHAGEPEAARRALSRAVRLGAAEGTVGGRGTALEAQVSLAELDAAAGDLASARRRLEAVLAETPSDPLPRYRLLGILARQGETAALVEHRERFEADARAMAAVQAALGRGPEEAANLHWLAETYHRLGLDHLAEVHYRQLLARDRDDEAARRGLAELALRHRGRPSAAEDEAMGGGS